MSKYSNEELWQLWELRVEEMMELGISQSEYARRNDIPASTLSYWVNKLKNNKTCTDSKAGNDAQPSDVPAWITVVPDVCKEDTKLQNYPLAEQPKESFELKTDDLCINSDISIYCGCFTVRVRDNVNSQLLDMVLRVVSANGLVAIVEGSFNLDPFSKALFIFCNRKRDKLKAVKWCGNGFELYYRRMEKGKFQYPFDFDSDNGKITISEADFNRLCNGLVMEQFVPHRRHVIM